MGQGGGGGVCRLVGVVSQLIGGEPGWGKVEKHPKAP